MKSTYKVPLLISGAILIIIFKFVAKKEVKEQATNELHNTQVNSPTQDTIKGKDESNEVWFYNTQHGIAFETPKAMIEIPIDLPSGTEKYVNNAHSYTLTESGVVINWLVMETKFKKYDPKEGLRGSVTNMINNVNGSDLLLEFSEVKNKYNDIICDATFYFKQVRMRAHGYCLYKKDGTVCTIIASGDDTPNTVSKIKRVIDSIRVLSEV